MSCSSQCFLALTLTLTVPGGHIQPDTHPWLTHSRSRFWQVLAHSIPASLALSHSNRCSGGGQEIERRPTGDTHTQRIHYMYLSEPLDNILSTCVSDVFKCNCARLEVHRDMSVRRNTSWRRMFIKEEVRQSRSSGFIRSALHGSTLAYTRKTLTQWYLKQ